MTELRRATLVYDGPLRWASTNKKLGMHWAERMKATADMRLFAFTKARESGHVLPRLEAAHIVVRHEYKTGQLPDTDAPALAVKALLDGLTDARVLPGDTGDHVLSISYLPAERSDRFALTLELIEDEPRVGHQPWSWRASARALRRALLLVTEAAMDEATS